jgi:hypothetical protein
MKASSATVVHILMGIALVTVLGCGQRLRPPSKPDFTLEFGDPAQNKYIELAKGDDDSDFCAALANIKLHGDCNADFKGTSKPPKHYDCSQPAVCLVTDKVTTSHLAKNDPVAGDPNIMYRVRSSKPEDITAVLKTFK